MEEINRNVLVVGDFAAFHKDNSANLVPMTVKVRMTFAVDAQTPHVQPGPLRTCFTANHVSSQVEDPAGSVLYEKKDVTQGQFAFTTKEDGDFKACFTAKGRT
jgi:p24 family protein delta-1